MTAIDISALSTITGGAFAPCRGITNTPPQQRTRDAWAIGVGQCCISKAEANAFLMTRDEPPLSRAELRRGHAERAERRRIPRACEARRWHRCCIASPTMATIDVDTLAAVTGGAEWGKYWKLYEKAPRSWLHPHPEGIKPDPYWDAIRDGKGKWVLGRRVDEAVVLAHQRLWKP